MISAQPPEGEEEFIHWEDRPPALGQKLRLYFDATHPDVSDVSTQAIWAAGEILSFGGNFNAFISSKDLAKQEGLIFRHLLRLVLLAEEFSQVTPTGLEADAWQAEMKELADKLTETCRSVDPMSTEEAMKKAHAADVVEGEEHAQQVVASQLSQPVEGFAEGDEFGTGILDD